MKAEHLSNAFKVLLALTLFACGSNPQFEVPQTSGMQWFKGNTHSHTTNSDGDSPPEVVAQWYKAHGYAFLVLSDHNFFTAPERLSSLVDSTFLLIAGEEVTVSFEGKPIHVNGLNIPRLVNPVIGSSLVGTIQQNVDAVRAVNGVPHINHPNFKWAFSHRELLQINHNKLLEIYNGHPFVNNLGGGGWPSTEQIWDHLLTAGKRIYGIAVDDAHHFQGEFSPSRSNPGRGWVVVRAKSLQAREIVENLENGLFYASTGVELENLIIEPRSLEIQIRQRGDFKYRTEFIGSGGKVLSQSDSTRAVYRLSCESKYVRAKVYESGGAVAWVQPVWVR
ncbi:MAG: CehA/McbA family metallohydrolase [candidate division KSB1 bacterium]|nr:CehA/McbA family metallohydrolase [candidate division KSB1 bacterium]